MARFKPPSLARPPVDGQMRGEYGDAVPGVCGVDACGYHARLWFGTKKDHPYSYEVYAMGDFLQVWASGDELVKARPLLNTAKSKKAAESFAGFIGRAGLAGFRAEAERSGVAFTHLGTEDHVSTVSKPSLRANVWKAAHRVAATCLHGIDGEDVAEDIKPMPAVVPAPRPWMVWWDALSPWARVAMARACEERIRAMLDDPRRPIRWWLRHFATSNWRGKAHGLSIRPAVGKTRRSCFDVLLGEWIEPGSLLVQQAEQMLEQANRSRLEHGLDPWPWNQPRKARPPGPLFERQLETETA